MLIEQVPYEDQLSRGINNWFINMCRFFKYYLSYYGG